MLKFIALCSLAALATTSPQDPVTTTYAVIVNSKNACSQSGSEVKATIKKLWLKQLSTWPDGSNAKPYGRKQGAAEQSAFLQDVLGMGEAELARYWLKVKNTNGTTPPKGVSLDRMLLKYIAKHEGALGVIELDKAKGVKGIKILYRF